MFYIFMYFFELPKSQNNSDFLVIKKVKILSFSRMKAIFKYLLLNFKSMPLGMFCNQINQTK